MKKTIVLGGLAALVIACLWASTPGNADDSQSESAAAVSPFKGRIIVTNSKTSHEFGSILEDAKVQRLGERYFLVGTAVDSGYPNDWQKGQVVWIAIDDISALTEFSDIEAYKKTAADQIGPAPGKPRN